MLGVLWCGCSFVSCIVIMSILFDVAISSSSASFLCIPLMFICSSFRLLFWLVLEVGFWNVFLVMVCCCVRGCEAVGEIVLVSWWRLHVHVSLVCLY